MKYLFSTPDEVLRKITSSKHLLLLLDYDGTLTPIVKKPKLAHIRPSTRRLLQRLAKLKKRIILGIISGRSLKDIKHLIRIPGIIYAGNHGLEIDFRGNIITHPGAKRFIKTVDEVTILLTEHLKSIPGILVEHKGVTLSLHYRMTPESYLPQVKRIFNDTIGSFRKTEKIKVTRGKKVFEVRPLGDWGKGKAVKRIIKNTGSRALPIYIGDDITDEDAFKVIGTKGITVFVGRPKKSYAQYFVWDVGEVIRFLKLLATEKH